MKTCLLWSRRTEKLEQSLKPRAVGKASPSAENPALNPRTKLHAAEIRGIFRLIPDNRNEISASNGSEISHGNAALPTIHRQQPVQGFR